MSSAQLAVLAGAAALLLVVLCALLVSLVRGRRRAARAVAASRADIEALQARVDALSAELEAARVHAAAAPAVPQTEYVITTAGRDRELPVVPERAVLSVTFGEPLVKAMAFAYGVRRALSPESRNRIAFEMRREVKRARKQRRRDARRATRVAAAGQRQEEAA